VSTSQAASTANHALHNPASVAVPAAVITTLVSVYKQANPVLQLKLSAAQAASARAIQVFSVAVAEAVVPSAVLKH